MHPAAPALSSAPGAASAPARVHLRPVAHGDRAFLLELYADTRAEELAPLGWDAAAIQAFLSMQFDIQDRAYRQTYPAASFDIVVHDGDAAGRLYVDRARESIHVIDIALLGAKRGCGIGTVLLRGLLREGQAAARPVTLSVLGAGPARRLYERLGFAVVGADEVYVHMEWRQEKTAS